MNGASSLASTSAKETGLRSRAVLEAVRLSCGVWVRMGHAFRVSRVRAFDELFSGVCAELGFIGTLMSASVMLAK